MKSNEAFLNALLGLVAIDSVALVDVSENAPYGSGPAKALDYVMDLCDELGIRTVNDDRKIAWAEIGEGEEIVGVLGHLDIVPAGDGWEHDPWGEICGDRLYGRGVVDDKGPTLAALFAMKELQDAGVPLKRRVRLILGQCEEVGDWTDMNYYTETYQLPVFGFTPDADFPAIYGEKGILNFDLTMSLEGGDLLSIEGGEASNMVPNWCRCTYRAEDGSEVKLETRGVSAHASTPEKGENAISKMMAKLEELGVKSPFVEFYRKHISFDFNGVPMGCGLEDVQSGKLTLNAGVLRMNGSEVTLTIDIRNPVTFGREDVEQPILRACEPYGIRCVCTESMDSIYMDKDGKVVRAMVDVYESITGDTSGPTVIGGGTYARAMPGIVAFGPMQPGRECTEHQANEYILLEDLFTAKEIYRQTIEKLANLD